MKTLTSKWRPSTASRHFAPEVVAAGTPAVRDTPMHRLALVAVGVALAAFHQAFDLKLGLPGHFGLVWMGVVVAASQISLSTWAATLAACGYVGGSMAFAGLSMHALTHVPIYAGVGLLLDAARHIGATAFRRTWFAGLAGGVAFAAKPLVLFALAATVGLEVGSLRHGHAVPIITHFAFGLTGAVLGTLAWRATQPDDRDD